MCWQLEPEKRPSGERLLTAYTSWYDSSHRHFRDTEEDRGIVQRKGQPNSSEPSLLSDSGSPFEAPSTAPMGSTSTSPGQGTSIVVVASRDNSYAATREVPIPREQSLRIEPYCLPIKKRLLNRDDMTAEQLKWCTNLNESFDEKWQQIPPIYGETDEEVVEEDESDNETSGMYLLYLQVSISICP